MAYVRGAASEEAWANAADSRREDTERQPERSGMKTFPLLILLFVYTFLFLSPKKRSSRRRQLRQIGEGTGQCRPSWTSCLQLHLLWTLVCTLMTGRVDDCVLITLQAEYDPIDHLNAIFAHPATLSSVSATSETLRSYQDDLDEDIAAFVATQSASDADSVERIQAAKAELADLFKKIESVRERAMQTEHTIADMTADIKRLDNTKRNLTLSMTALKRLQMLTTAYEQLRSLSKSRQYRECAQLLQAVIQLVAHFKSYRSIDQIATLSRNVAELQSELLEQICEDFEVIFAKGEVAQRKATLTEACLVMDALGDHARTRLINWYCNTQLREYRQVFRGNDEVGVPRFCESYSFLANNLQAGSLDNISRRYSWFNRMMKTYDVEHATIFPSFWKVNEMLANSFCEGTRDDFKAILQRSMRRADGPALDVDLLLSCLQETLNFEHSLERRFSNEVC